MCEGWTTADLAAHLVARERRPDSGPGLVWPRLAGYTDKVRTTVRDRSSYEELVETNRKRQRSDQAAANKAGNPLWKIRHGSRRPHAQKLTGERALTEKVFLA